VTEPRDLVAELTSCEHVIDYSRSDVRRYVETYFLGDGTILEVCGLCGARRIRGTGTDSWTRPELVEQIAGLS
jgi:hypothetical protein